MATRSNPADVLADFTAEDMTFDGATRRVYRLGTGPAVIIMAEMPGISPAVADFARRVAAIGATAVMPSLYGTDGQDPRPENLGRLGAQLNMAGTIVRTCISREFTVFATGRSSPVTDWLRALAAHEHERCGGRGVGAVGMCFTGGFALAMAVDDRMLAPVLSQPSLPFGHARAIDISDDALATVSARCAAGLEVMGLRFSGDRLVPPARFEFLRAKLGDAFLVVDLPDSTARKSSLLPRPHSVLTENLIDEPGEPTYEARRDVLEFLRRKLEIAPPQD